MSGPPAYGRTVGQLDFPMLIVTAAADGERSGCLVGFATQCSIDPPRHLVCISKQNHTCRIATRSAHLAVHVLDRLDLGDHVGHLLEPVDGELSGELDLLTFQQVRDMEPGHPA